MLSGHNRIDHVRSTVQFGTRFSTRSSEVIRLLEEVGVQFTPELTVGDARRTSANVSEDSSHTNFNLNVNQHSASRTAHMCVHIIDLHTPPDSLSHLQYCNFIIRMLFGQAY